MAWLSFLGLPRIPFSFVPANSIVSRRTSYCIFARDPEKVLFFVALGAFFLLEAVSALPIFC